MVSYPRFHGNRRSLSAFSVRNALAAALMQIKAEDELTFKDVGRILGVGEDQAARYCDGTASIKAENLYFGKREWNGRLTGLADKLLETVEQQDAHKAQTLILKAALALSAALEDGDLSENEILANRTILENAKEAIDKTLGRLGPRATEDRA